MGEALPNFQIYFENRFRSEDSKTTGGKAGTESGSRQESDMLERNAFEWARHYQISKFILKTGSVRRTRRQQGERQERSRDQDKSRTCWSVTRSNGRGITKFPNLF